MPRSLLGPWRRLKVGALLLLLSTPAGLRLGDLLVGRAGAQGNKDKDTNRERPLAPPGTPVDAKGRPLGKDTDVARDVGRDLMRELRKGQGKAPAGDEAPAVPPLRFEGLLAPAQTALRAGQYPDAAQRAQKLAETSKDPIVRDEAAALAGEALLRQGLLDQAEKLLDGAVQRDAMALAARVELGLVLRHRGDARERAIWDRFFDDYDADRISGEDPRQLRLLGIAARFLGSYHDSYEQLRKAVTLAKEQKKGWEYVHANLALTELRIEKYEVGYAETSLDEALRRDPDSPEGHALLARIKLEQGNNVAEATEHIERALKVDPRFGPALALRAEIYIDNEQYEEALAVLDPVIQRNPYDLTSRSLRAAALFLLEKPAEAAAERAEVLKRSPHFTTMHRIIGERLVVQHRYEDLVKLLEEAVQLVPKDAYALGDLGRAYLYLGDEDNGYKALLRAWKGDKFNRRTYNLLNLFEDIIKKKYTTVTADLDPSKPGSGGLRLRVSKDEEAMLVPLVLPMIQTEWRELTKRYGYTPPTPLTVELYKEPDNYAVRTVGLPNLAALGVTFGRVVTGRSPAEGNFNWGLMVWHELSHVFAIQLTAGRVPRWFTEGLSEWETMNADPDWQRRTHAEVAKALSEGKLLSIADLNVGFTRAKDLSNIVVAYHEAALAVDFLVRSCGFPKIVEALKMFAKGKRTREVLQAISGKSLAELDAAFRADLKARFKAYEGTFYIRPSEYSDLEGLAKQIKEKGQQPGAARLNGLLAVALGRSGGDPAEIKAAIAAALKLDPGCKEALLADGELLQRLGKPAEAEARFQELIQKGGDGFDVRQRLGDSLSARELYDKAQAEYMRAKALDPDRSEPYERLAKNFTKQKREAEALKELEAAAHLDIMDSRLAADLVERLHGQKQWAKVIELGELALHLTPYRGSLRAQLGEAWLELGQPARALAELGAAKQALPDPADVPEEDAGEVVKQRKAIEALMERAKRTKARPLPVLPETLLGRAKKRIEAKL
ncbi:MAG: tetratricopeptide repeat protein [Polyangia bacterium]